MFVQALQGLRPSPFDPPGAGQRTLDNPHQQIDLPFAGVPPYKSRNPTGSITEPGATQSPQSARTHASNEDGSLTDRLIHTVVTNQNDALNLLFDAAEHQTSAQDDADTAEEDMQDSGAALEDGNVPPSQTGLSPSSTATSSTDKWCSLRHRLSKPKPDVVEVWKSCPFVKQRWMSPEEAVTYVDLFFRNMMSLSPILDNHFANHSNHKTLITEEPALCCTIIMLSARYHLLVGEGGLTRGILLHERLWEYCQSLFQQVVWGHPHSVKRNTRTLGTIESLLLVTEWHPRSFHLSPDLNSNDSDVDESKNQESAEKTRGMLLSKALSGTLHY